MLRSPNAKYHYSYLFFYKINKGHLLLMYSCVFFVWNQRFGRFFGCYCLTPVTLFIIRSKDSTEKQPAVRTLSNQRRVRPENPSNRRYLFNQRQTSIIATLQQTFKSDACRWNISSSHVENTFCLRTLWYGN